MPSKSQSQHGLMAMCSTPAGRAKAAAYDIECPSQKVATKFRHADKGRKVSKLPKHTKGYKK